MKVLIFGTSYVDTEAKRDLADKWWLLHGSINPACDLLFVDSASPLLPRGYVNILQLGDNIGHLSRSGRDGWGRAFCAGLRYAMDHKYDWVVHVEGDSLCKLDIVAECKRAEKARMDVVSVPVRGTKRVEKDWVETGIMMMRVPFVRTHRVVEMYDWKDGVSKSYPHTPEWVLQYLLGHHLTMAAWKTIRDDINSVTPETAGSYDWISHSTPDVYDAFVASAMEHA